MFECPYGGTMLVRANGREEIKQTHYGRDMDVGSDWVGWSFPIPEWTINGNRIFSRWVNRGPGKRPDGSHYETQGVSFIIYGGEGKFSSQLELFDIARQMNLHDELDEVGLLAPELREQWVKPMIARILAMLEGNG